MKAIELHHRNRWKPQAALESSWSGGGNGGGGGNNGVGDSNGGGRD